MSIEWMENFQNYGTGSTGLANIVDGMWAEVSTTTHHDMVSDPDGVSSGNVFRMDGSSDSAEPARRVLPSGNNVTVVGLAFRLWLEELPGGENQGATIYFRDLNNSTQATLTVATNGALVLKRGTPASGTQLAITSIPVITAAAWNHLEIKMTIDDSAGACEVRVNGVTRMDVDTLDTKATSETGCAQVAFTASGSAGNPGYNTYWKDIICWNTSGSVNNDFLGDCQVVTLLPDGDNAFNWTASTGSTGYNLIDETDPDDADYISADATPPSASVFTLSNLDPDVVTIKGLQPVQRSLKTDGGTANVQMSLRSNGSDDSGTDQPITVAATYWFDISELDPNTAGAWTPAAVDAALLVIDRTT